MNIINVFILSYNFRHNIINNECIFNKKYLQPRNVLCIDYGLNKKYCDNNLIEEYEINLIDKEITIKPYSLYEKSILYNKKYKIADIYYYYSCSDNSSTLISGIYPEMQYDKHILIEILETISNLLILILLFTFIIKNIYKLYIIILIITILYLLINN